MNLFLPVYKRIEADVINLSYNILFDDSQWNVYSLAISDLLLKCAVEIEAISKALYLSLGGVENPIDEYTGNPRDLYFDTDCIELLVQMWHIDQKKVQITNPNMYFSSSKSVLTPLHKSNKRGSSGSKWKRAYQAVKHNRSESIKMATVENLMNALGALYILNLYYSNESFWLEKPIQNRREFKIDSEIFTPFTCNATIDFAMSSNMGDSRNEKYTKPSIEESIYVKKITDKSFKDVHTLFCENQLRNILMIKNSKVYKDYIAEHPEAEEQNLGDVARKIGIDVHELEKQDGRLYRAFQLIKNQEVILVKDLRIYKECTFAEYMQEMEGKPLSAEFQNIVDADNVVVPMLPVKK